MSEPMAYSAFRLPPPCDFDHPLAQSIDLSLPVWAKRVAARILVDNEGTPAEAAEAVANIKAATESPIEAALLGALQELNQIGFGIEASMAIMADRIGWSIGRVHTELASLLPTHFRRYVFLIVTPQVRIGEYRADLLLTLVDGRPGREAIRHTVVECDGHEFHERTKEQAARDRARDRALLAMGVPTIRFTGSEIHADPMRCAVEAMTLAGVRGVSFEAAEDAAE